MQISAGHTIVEALEAVDRFHEHVPGSKSATLCVGSLDFAAGEFQYCTAGHPPPLSADATARYLEPSGAGPLGSGAGFPVPTEVLDIGDSILLYSDGLIERPGRPLGASTAEFADLAAKIAGGGGGFVIDAPARPIDRICSETPELLLRPTGYNESRSGIAPLTIDLSGVTHLGSAGVRAPAAARDRARRQGGDFVLVAPPGSPAHHVLSLVRIPVVSSDPLSVFAEE